MCTNFYNKVYNPYNNDSFHGENILGRSYSVKQILLNMPVALIGLFLILGLYFYFRISTASIIELITAPLILLTYLIVSYRIRVIEYDPEKLELIELTSTFKENDKVSINIIMIPGVYISTHLFLFILLIIKKDHFKTSYLDLIKKNNHE